MIKKSIKNLGMKIRGQTPTSELVKRGMKVGKNFSRRNTTWFDHTFAFLIEIGDNVTFAGGGCVLAHDASTGRSLGCTKLGRVKIGNRVFVGANVTVLPGVEIGDDVVIGAGSVVTHDIPSGSVAAGNPARVISTLDEYLEKQKSRMESTPVIEAGELTEQKIREICDDIGKDGGFIKY